MAGLEERLSKLESILHRLFCCDTNQFTGPQGPQGPQGEDGEDGLQGPPGVDGLITFQNLNWVGAWVPCVIYNQFDAISYLGSSYFMNCESSATYECEVPTENPSCWILLANQGATGPQGPTGLTGVSGNDGSNSGRWKFLTTINNVGAPGATYFVTDTLNLNTLTEIRVNFDDINSTDYEAWWKALYDFGVDYPGSLFFIQITEVGSNNIIGIYKVEYKAPAFEMTLSPNHISIGLDPMYVSNSVFTPNKNYTISWSIHGGVSGAIAPKTKGEVLATLIPAPFPTLEYDFNEIYSDNPWTPLPFPGPSLLYYVALPTPTFRGQELFFVAKGDYEFGVITHDGSSTMFLYGADILTSEFVIHPKDAYKATWDGNYWLISLIQGQTSQFNDRRVVLNKFVTRETVLDPLVVVYPTLAWLNSNYPNSAVAVGFKLYLPNIPGGPRCFVRVSDTEWQSFATTTVI